MTRHELAVMRSLETGAASQFLAQLTQLAEQYQSYLETIEEDERFNVEAGALLHAAANFLAQQVFYTTSHVCHTEQDLEVLQGQCAALVDETIKQIHYRIRKSGGKCQLVEVGREN